MLVTKSLLIGRFLLVLAVLSLSISPAVFAGTNGKIDLNTATVEQLEQLPGIGSKTAEAIVKYRENHPFKAVEELTNIKGIGKKKLERLKPLVTVKSDSEG